MKGRTITNFPGLFDFDWQEGAYRNQNSGELLFMPVSYDCLFNVRAVDLTVSVEIEDIGMAISALVVEFMLDGGDLLEDTK